jgi:hypothetical protein
MVERPARGEKDAGVPALAGTQEPSKDGTPNKKPSDPGKTENEGIQRILSKTIRQAGLILLFDGEVGCGGDGHRPPLQQP